MAFNAAVRDLLRDWGSSGLVSANPLTRTRLAAPLDRSEEERTETLRRAVILAVESLAQDPRASRFSRVLEATFLGSGLTQRMAAERLGLPYSTYRRHLTDAVQRVQEKLWELELFGAAPRPAKSSRAAASRDQP
jgi:DNA-directed RNA polymerase specialized sigma24 family protein